ncbi:MAG: tetratricopeptide (TPR) repeat protein, partial [Pseudoalteromonas tetraodonis]
MIKPSALLIALLSFLLTGSSFAFLDIFKGDLDKVPESSEIRAQDELAKTKLQSAQEYESAGKSDKALDIYKGIARKWPVTTSAAIAQYKVGAIQKSQGDYVKAFDSFQTFVDDHKQSSAFSAAIASQFEIAKASQTGEYKEKLVVRSRKVQRSEVLEMYGNVIKNAPYSEYAPQAQFSMGEVLEEDRDKYQLAVLEYKKVVKDYPETKLAGRAQFRIAEIGRMAIEAGSRNAANVGESRDAYNDVMLVDQTDAARREEARSRVVQFDELEAKKAFDIGRFYEKQKNYKSAALYYRRVAKSTNTTASAEAQERLAIVEAKISGAPTSAAEEPSGF